jgi:hypothetical protein
MRSLRAPECLALALAVISYGALADGIDLDCETLSEQMVERLDAEGLLIQTESGRQRALSITLDLCGGAEESAEQQSEVEKQQALDNWFFEKHPEKPGNKRLKNLKR